MRGKRRRPEPGGEARFWGLLLVVLSVVIHGWYAREFEVRVGLPVVPGDGALHPRDILERMAAYGSAGRQSYVAFLSLACLVPVTASLVLARLYELLGDARYRRPLAIIAALPALSGLAENTLLALLAMTYPSADLYLASLAYAFTALKVVAWAAAGLALAVLASAWLRRRVEPDPHETI